MTGKEEHSQIVVNIIIWLQKMLKLKCGMLMVNQKTSSSQLQVKVSRIELQTKIGEDFTFTERAPKRAFSMLKALFTFKKLH